MRCARCDGLVVPQAVGIHPDGRVVFGWCLRCLARARCRLVEIPGVGLRDLVLDFRAREAPAPPRPGRAPMAAVDQSQWILALVSVLMMCSGLILLAAGLFSGPSTGSEPGASAGPTPALLGLGGAATALSGLGLMILASHRDWLPGPLAPVLASWVSFGFGLVVLACAILDYQPRRNVPIILGVGVAMLISVATRLLERAQRGKPTARRPPSTSGTVATEGSASSHGLNRIL